ncbi:MAG: hypothetical protein GXP35_11885 [Actinobacteria bacterium]|nr:hypothetical protein [Actinomycetota bacterium]
MSTNQDTAFERLRRAKPISITPLPARSAAEFLDELEGDGPEPWLAPGPTRDTRRPVLAAAIILLVGGVAIALAASANREPPVDAVAPLTEVTFNSSAADLPPAGSMIGGVYQANSLGTPLSMDLDEIWSLLAHEAGAIELSDGGTVSIIRPTNLADPADLAADPMFTWPTTDLDGWLNNVSPSVTIIEATDVGRDGLRVFDLQVTEGLCPNLTTCVPLLTTRGTFDVFVGSSEQTRVWWFTMEPFGPLVVVATGPVSTIQNADTLVQSMGFGPNAAHPLAQQEPWEAGLNGELPAGRIALPALGGLEFDLPFAAAMRQSDDAVVVELTALARLEILIVDRAADGTAVTTVAEATAALAPHVEVAPAGVLETALGEMAVIDLANGPTSSSNLALLTPDRGFAPGTATDSYTWLVPRSGRLWMIEVENGVLLVSAGVLEDSALDDPTIERNLFELGETVARTIRLGAG